MVSPETGLPLCIETTRHVVEAFHQAGVPEARALPVALYAFNRQASAHILAGGTGEPEKGAQRVEVSPEAIGRSKKHGWAGHLVVDHPEFILDLVLPGVFKSTGAKGFEHVRAFCGEKRNELIEVDGTWMAMTADGLCFRFQPRPRLAAWRNTDAWRGPVDRVAVRQLAAEIRSLVDDAEVSSDP